MMAPTTDERLVIEPPVTPDAPPTRLLQHPVPDATGRYLWVYLWQAPLRAMHWVAAIAIVLLIASGFWIGRPFFLSNAQTTGSYATQWARLIHFVAAWLLAATAIVRVYWLVAGNRFERLPALFPLRPRDWRNMVKQILYYSFIRREEDTPKYVGHNPFQQLFYTSLYAAAIVMVVTGFALYGLATPDGLVFRLFNWVNDLFGMQLVRFVHHVTTWYFVIFPITHIYFAMRSDVTEHGGGISSIISGGKFVDARHQYEDNP